MKNQNGITVTMLKTVTSDLSNFKTWLSTNPVAIQYQLAESNVKTVEEALALPASEGTINDLIVAKTAKIGEKLSFRRFEIVEKTDDQLY